MLVINFHNVVSGPLDAFDRNAAPRVDVRQFTSAIDWLGKRFEIISFNEFLLRLKQKPTNDQAVTLTFDDGYCGVWRHAFPILKKRGLDAAVMVVTQALESASELFHFEELEMAFRISRATQLNLPWRRPQSIETVTDRICCLKTLKQALKLQPESLRVRHHDQLLQHLGVTREQFREASKKFPVFEKLSGEQLKLLAKGGWTIGSHTRTHRTLSCLNDEEAMQEITASRDDIHAHLGLKDMPFAYPYGGPQHIGDRIHKMVGKSPYTCALTTTAGRNSPASNRFRLRRINIEYFYEHQPEIFDGMEEARKTNTFHWEKFYEQSSIH